MPILNTHYNSTANHAPQIVGVHPRVRSTHVPCLLILTARAVEEYPGSSVVERTSRLHTLSDLGPADLCSIHKITESKKTAIGTFLYYTGVDTANSASIAAHLQALATLILARSQYWFGEKKHWKVPELTYCTYNAFSKVDMRVTVHIPGKFEAVVVGSDGKLVHDKLSEAELDRLWLETSACSIVRCLLDADEDEVNRVGGLVEIRRENPLNNGWVSKEMLANFVAAFEQLFWQGPKLGCSIEIPQATLLLNYLVDGFLKCIQLTQSYDIALETLRRLEAQEPAVAVLIAQVLLMKDDEITAVQVMGEGIARDKRDSELLLLQTHFLMDKKRYDLALPMAKQAVQSAPSDFKTWTALVKVYTKLNDFENALLTLNSCPMNSHKDKFSLRRIIPLRGGGDDLHLPSPVDVTLDEVSNLQSTAIAFEQKNLDPQLTNLPAANLKSTFTLAYDLLTDIVIKTGWESLLKYRAKVFVMEEEYRKDKNGKRADEKAEPEKAEQVDGSTASISEQAASISEQAANSLPTDVSSTTAVKSPKKEANGDHEHEYKKKRLCERWLDNLFMLLYEDLRAYTMWQAEYVHFQAQQMEYKRSTLEWEILGLIAFRLKHFKEGSVAFSNALAGRFSARSQREMLKYYQMERKKLLSKSTLADAGANGSQNYTKTINQLNEKILECCIKLLVWNHRWYNDFSAPLTLILEELVAEEGLIKIQSLVQAVYSNNINHSEGMANHGITDMMDDMYELFKAYKISGVDN